MSTTYKNTITYTITVNTYVKHIISLFKAEIYAVLSLKIYHLRTTTKQEPGDFRTYVYSFRISTRQVYVAWRDT